MHHLVLHRSDVAGVERSAAARRVGEYGSQGEHIGGRADPLPQDLFRGAVTGSDWDLACGGEGQPVFGAGDAEVDDSRSNRRQDDVRRLEVTVYKSSNMDVVQCVGEG